MLFRSSAHPGKAVRLGYCMNLHAAETLDELIGGMRRITLPLRERLAPKSELGVGMYLPAKLAHELANDAAQLATLKRFLDEHALDPFTYNAFPYGGFQTDGLKERVFEPTWLQRARMGFTLDVANVATRLATEASSSRHVSISTHTGAHSSSMRKRGERELKRGCVDAFVRAASELAMIEARTGARCVLSLEPEPRAIAEHFFDVVAMVVIGGGPRAVGSPDLAPFERHVGLCVDACHAAVEFEDLSQNIELIRTFRAGIGKLQFTSAVCVRDPVSNRQGVAALLALDEPRYLHQVTGQGPDAVARVGDLPELAQALQHERSPWWRCAEWRCHFHVPVDIESFDGTGLSTTREYANGALAIALVEPAKWRTNELHVEIETYTWDVLPRAARGAGELVDGLEREYRHVIGELDKSGWKHASS